MLRRATSGGIRLVRGMALFGGAAVTLALILGAGTVALAAAPGDPFKLGKNNVVNNALTALIGSRAGGAMLLVDNNSNAAGSRALDLRVQQGRAPMTVNANAGKAVGLNADRLDGKSVGQIGVNGLERVLAYSAENSVSAKSATVFCPAGKVALGTNYFVVGGRTGFQPDVEQNVTIDNVFSSGNVVQISAVENQPYSQDWYVAAGAICATAP